MEDKELRQTDDNNKREEVKRDNKPFTKGKRRENHTKHNKHHAVLRKHNSPCNKTLEIHYLQYIAG